MGWNFRRSIKILPGVRLNLGKKSWGVSVGDKYGGISYNSKTGVTARTSIPGTGISYTEKLPSGAKKQSPQGKPPRNNHTGLWVLGVLLALAGLAISTESVPCGLLYLLAGAATLPIPAVQDRLHALRVRGGMKVAVVLALMVAGSAFLLRDSAESAQDSVETPPEQVAEPAPVEETPEKSAQSPESIVEFLNTMYSGLGMENYTVSYDDGAFVINLWEPGLTGIATRMANGGEDIPEDLTVQYETWAQTATSLSDSAHKFVTEAGRDEDVKVFILNERNRENVIFCAINGVVFYDIGRGITW